MKHKVTDINDYYIHTRLCVWARWVVKCTTQGLGYPSKSVEGRLVQDGGVLPKSTAPLLCPTNPDAEEVDVLINELGCYDAALVDAIKLKYLGRNSFYQEAKLRNIPLPTLKNNLRRAKDWLAGSLFRKTGSL